MWTASNKMDFFGLCNGAGASYFNGMTTQDQNNQPMPKASMISSGYPFISGHGPQYRPTPVLQVAPVLHQYDTRPVVHAPPILHHSQHVSTAGRPLITCTTASPTFNVNRVCSMPSRDGFTYGTNGKMYSATPMTPQRENIAAVACANGPLSPQPSTSGLVRRPKKRKSLDSHDVGTHGGKVFINEERMANCLQDLSLASNCSNSVSDTRSIKPKSPVASLPLSSWLLDPRKPVDARRIIDEIDSRLSVDDIESDDEGDEENSYENNNNNEEEVSRLIISKDFEMSLGNNDILPNNLFEQLNKPCMEMVLWKPPGDFVKKAVTSSLKTPSSDLSVSHNGDCEMISLASESRTEHSDDSQENCVISEIRPDVLVEDLFDSVDDEMEL